jgi:hypothetical protein
LRLPQRFVGNLFSGYSFVAGVAAFTLFLAALAAPQLRGLRVPGPLIQIGQTVSGYGALLTLVCALAIATWKTAQQENARSYGLAIDLVKSLAIEPEPGTFLAATPYVQHGTSLTFNCVNRDRQGRALTGCRARIDSLQRLADGAWTTPGWFPSPGPFLLWEHDQEEVSIGPASSLHTRFVAHDDDAFVIRIQHHARYRTWWLEEGRWRASVAWTANNARPVSRDVEFECGARGATPQTLRWLTAGRSTAPGQ